VRRLIYASSCAVYGNTQFSHQNESMLPSPLSPYAAAKVSVEGYLKAFHKVYGLETVSLRLFNVYGPRLRLGVYSSVLAQFIDRLLRKEHPVIYGDGEQMRDFTYVEDVVDAHMLALKSTNAAGEVFNIGTGCATRINDLVDIVAKVIGVKAIRPTHSESQFGDVVHSCGDITKARNILGYSPRLSLEEGLKELWEWQRREQTHSGRVRGTS